MTDEPPAKLTDWLGQEWTPNSDGKAAHPNARFTAPAAQCPVIDPAWEDPKGVPISAFLFGGRRATTVPFVLEAFNWRHGTFLGSVMASEKTAAAAGKVGMLRRDPMAMLPFCGYNMADYFAHWLALGAKADAPKLPRIYYVNWFRKDEAGKFIWPGYGENSRVLKWIVERISGGGAADETPVGLVPADGAIDTSGLKIAPDAMEVLRRIDKAGWSEELASIKEHFATFGDRLPKGLNEELAAMEKRLQSA
jgi:phosphoenolpyruvate carboxykinase (GTP)